MLMLTHGTDTMVDIYDTEDIMVDTMDIHIDMDMDIGDVRREVLNLSQPLMQMLMLILMLTPGTHIMVAIYWDTVVIMVDMVMDTDMGDGLTTVMDTMDKPRFSSSTISIEKATYNSRAKALNFFLQMKKAVWSLCHWVLETVYQIKNDNYLC